MSRTRRHTDEGQSTRPAKGIGFEVGRKVCGVQLKSLKVSIKPDRKVLALHFLKNGLWISKYINIYPESHFLDRLAYDAHRRDIKEILENICTCYVSTESMKRIFINSTGWSIIGIVNEINRTLSEVDFKKKNICIKTVPTKNGGVEVGRFHPFMQPESGSNIELRYSQWEELRYLKHKFNK